MQKINRPIWQPTFVSIQELMEHVSGLHTSDRIKLIVELYKVYSKHHQETFDSFYFGATCCSPISTRSTNI